MKKSYVFSFVLFLVSEILAYRPFVTEDAGVAGKGVFQTEISYDFVQWETGEKEDVFMLVSPIYGLTERLEYSYEVPYLNHRDTNQSGIGDMNIALKFLMFDLQDKTFQVTLKTIIKLDTGNAGKGLGSGDNDYSLSFAASKAFNRFITHSQFGNNFIGKAGDSNIRDIYLFGFGIDRTINEKLNLVTEIVTNSHPDKTITDNPLSLMVGFIYKLSEKLVFDISLRKGLNKSSPEINPGLGCSVTF